MEGRRQKSERKDGEKMSKARMKRQSGKKRLHVVPWHCNMCRLVEEAEAHNSAG